MTHYDLSKHITMDRLMTTSSIAPTGYILRPPTLDDAPGVLDVMNANALDSIGQADDNLDDLLEWWQSPEISRDSNLRVLVNADGRVVGYGELDDSRPVLPMLDLYVHPDQDRQALGQILYAWVEQRAREAIPRAPEGARVALRGFTYDMDLWYHELLRACGLTCIRHSYRMEIRFEGTLTPPVMPDGFRLRLADPQREQVAIYHAYCDTFRDHFGFVEEPFEIGFAHWEQMWQKFQPIDPALWIVAETADGQIAGVCLCKPYHATQPDMGWVSVLGVRREYRRTGLGMALLRQAFVTFQQMGRAGVGLGVDASSLTGATRLYERAGMRVVLRFDMYEKELRDGIEMTVTDLGQDD
jgi:mycothiol synthase